LPAGVLVPPQSASQAVQNAEQIARGLNDAVLAARAGSGGPWRQGGAAVASQPGPQLTEGRPADDGTVEPRSDAQQKRPAPWILPLAGVFAVTGTVLLAAAGVQKACRRAAEQAGQRSVVTPLCSPDGSDVARSSSPLMESADRLDVVSSFESQVEEAKQRAKALTRGRLPRAPCKPSSSPPGP